MAANWLSAESEAWLKPPRIVWSVYLERSNAHGPLPPMRMICSSEGDAHKEFSQPGAVAIGREEILEEKAREEKRGS